MDNQDWKTVVLRKKSPSQSNRIQVDPTLKKIINLESEDPTAPKKLGKDCAQQIQKARCTLKLKQEDLAKKINVKANIIKEYETGNVVPDRGILNKLNRALNIKIDY
jgi:ribosome-binding protein aMBF1 (putative translation factor)